MLHRFVAGVLLVILTTFAVQATPLPDQQPKADVDAVVTARNARFTILTPSLIRLEWSPDKQFEDRASLMAVNRKLPVPEFTSSTRRGWLTIETSDLVLKYRYRKGRFDESNLSIQYKLGDSTCTWTPGMEDNGNLGGTVRTLDGVSGSTPLDPGLLSRDGWVVVDDSHNLLLEGDPLWPTPRPDRDAIDWYFFGYGHRYTEALKDYTRISGTIPLPPRYSFGAWWSRYWAYSADELKELVLSFEEHDVPLDVLVVDMDWHLEGWTGYTWNRDLFPNPQKFLSWVHKQGLHTTLNLHPHDGVRPHEEAFPEMARAMGLDPDSVDHIAFDIADPRYMKAYFEVLHRPLEKQGVDFWWIDWQQGEASRIPGLDPLIWLNHLHWRDMETRQQATGRRPLIFSRWGGLGNHRYEIGFSGDTFNDWASLAFQPYFTATAGNVAYPYWSHDIGGHQPGPVEGELYARWIQFAVLNPYLRTHSGKNPNAERRIWEFGDEIFRVARDAFRQRYELVPYIYTSARQAYDDALPLMRPLYYEWPELDEAYNHPGQYLFGDQLLAVPVVQPRERASRCAMSTVWLPPGTWVHWYTGEQFEGPSEQTLMTPLDQVPLFARAGAIIPTTPASRRIGTTLPEIICFEIFPGDQGQFTLYEDDGISAGYENSESASTKVSFRRTASGYAVTIDSSRGSFEGMHEQRTWQVRMRDTAPPSTVSLNGTELPRITDESHLDGARWWYDADELAAVIELPGSDVHAVQQVTIEGRVEDRRALNRFRGRLALLEEFTQRFGEDAPADAELLLIDRGHLADSTSGPTDLLSLAQRVQEKWSGIAAAFSRADVAETLRREAFLRLYGLSLNWTPVHQDAKVEATVGLTLLEEVEGLDALVEITIPEGWEASGDVANDRVSLIPHETLRWTRLLTPPSVYGPASIHADISLNLGEEHFEVPFETALFPSIGAWQVIGPFDNPSRHELDTPFGPESDLDLSTFHEGKGGEQIRWHLVARKENSPLDTEFVVDLQQFVGEQTEDAVAYGLTWLDAPEARDAVLALGSDDGVKVWLNGEVVHENVIGRPYTSRSDLIPIYLNAGMNMLLVKVSQGNGGWAFGAHLEDENGRELSEVRVVPMQ